MRKLDFYKEEWDIFLRDCDFTDIEKNIITLVRRGWRVIDIAYELGYSETTIKRYRSRIADKIMHWYLINIFKS